MPTMDSADVMILTLHYASVANLRLMTSSEFSVGMKKRLVTAFQPTLA